LNLREMLTGHVTRLKYVYRFGTIRVLRPESVAEHSYYTALYSHLIAYHVNSKPAHLRENDVGLPIQIDIGSVLSRALWHDMDEARSGDFPRPFKHSNPDLKAMLDTAAKMAMSQVLRDLCDEPCQARIASVWKTAKDDSPEGRILDFADYLCVLAYMRQEYNAVNTTMAENAEGMRVYLQRFYAAEFDFLRDLVQQARVISDEIFGSQKEDRPERPDEIIRR
jgi:5'-deoxynucleotidase